MKVKNWVKTQLIKFKAEKSENHQLKIINCLNEEINSELKTILIKVKMKI